jgi:hypothetical protein
MSKTHRSTPVEDYCPECFTLYYACPGCTYSICDCSDAQCECNDGSPLGILNAYLEDFEIPEALKEREKDE